MPSNAGSWIVGFLFRSMSVLQLKQSRWGKRTIRSKVTSVCLRDKLKERGGEKEKWKGRQQSAREEEKNGVKWREYETKEIIVPWTHHSFYFIMCMFFLYYYFRFEFKAMTLSARAKCFVISRRKVDLLTMILAIRILHIFLKWFHWT